MVKEFLSQRGITFTDIDVSKDQVAARDIFTRTGQMGVPVTTIDGKAIVGFNRAQSELALAEVQQAPPAGRPQLGAAIADAGKVVAREGSAATSGAYVGHVHPGSVAERMGLRAGDTVTTANEQAVATAADLERALAPLAGGSRLALTVLRGAETVTLEGTL